MIETDEQRRWWFATHPEYSSSRKGGKKRRRTEQESNGKVPPEEVDAYVDHALKHVSGPVAELLKSVKRNFGTDADSRKGEQSSSEIVARQNRDRYGQWPSPWLRRTGYFLYGRAFTPRLPTAGELFRLPEEMARRYIRGLKALLQKYPFLIDPDALERHHGLPKQWQKHFKAAGIDIEEFVIVMTVAKHRLKPHGLHTGKGRGGDWNTRWKKFFRENDPENTPEFRSKIIEEYEKMKEETGLK